MSEPLPVWTHTGFAQQIRFGSGAVGEVARVVRELGGRRVLLVTTCRPGYQAPWRTQSNATQIALGPLSTGEARELVESLLAAAPATEAVLSRLLDRGEGNPFCGVRRENMRRF